MLFKANFNYQAWIKELPIEAEDEDEAMEKLRKMTLEEICECVTNEYIDEGYVKDSAIDDVDLKQSEWKTKVRVYEVEFLDDDGNELHPEGAEPYYYLTLDTTDKDDLEDLITDELADELDLDPAEIRHFKYDVIKEY